MVVEKSAEIGGSAVLSGGGLWTVSSAAEFLEVDPHAERHLVELLVSRFGQAGEWVESLGVPIGAPIALDAIQGYPSVARVIDNLAYISRCRAKVESSEGAIVASATVVELSVEDGRVCGAVAADRGGESVVRAAWTLLATGGFQGAEELRGRYIGEHARDLLLRSNPGSTGDGLRLAMSVGASLRLTDSFYGHLVPAPLPGGLPPEAYLRLAQLYSTRALLLDHDGRRICDESFAYYANAVAVSRLPGRRGLLVADQAVRDYDRTAYGPAEQVDRPAEAARAGAHVAEASTLAELDALVAEWGYLGVAAAAEEFNQFLTDAPAALQPPRKRNRTPLSTPPFFAMEVQPAITSTFSGLRVDAGARVLDERGQPIPGLLAAGADVGIYHSAYAGGLALGLILGLQAASTALGSNCEVVGPS
jgi:succinate dehydrogenase/fumarate reductase flavoprotein subunit